MSCAFTVDYIKIEWKYIICVPGLYLHPHGQADMQSGWFQLLRANWARHLLIVLTKKWTLFWCFAYGMFSLVSDLVQTYWICILEHALDCYSFFALWNISLVSSVLHKILPDGICNINGKRDKKMFQSAKISCDKSSPNRAAGLKRDIPFQEI